MHFIPRVSKFGCCLSLRTGTLILAWLGTISSFIGLMVVIVAVTMGVDVIVNLMSDNNIEINVGNLTAIDLGLETINETDVKVYVLHILVTTTLLTMLVFSLWSFVAFFLLLIGAHNNKAGLVGQWLISGVIWLVVNVMEVICLGYIATKGVYGERIGPMVVGSVIRLGKCYIQWVYQYMA